MSRGLVASMLRGLAVALSLAIAVPAAHAATVADVIALVEAKQYKEAFAAVKPLADGGDVRAMTMLGNLYRNGQGTEASSEDARKWFAKAAEAGDAEAQFNYAMLLIDENGISVSARFETLGK